ncbi:TraE/TraK family type IV conjugative transfer system protein [Ferrovum sp.]|uniref:TraE/TraK family type IV conjugative transfer system protein n=1 Tax=Ferrovum sp. TaxID=2609467 RepID=UPI002637F37E|nr:TraE/TraK family type IV conjugative transfer system protein [Ferrovum sp.]
MKFLWQKTTWENSIKANMMLSASNVIMACIALFAAYASLTSHERVVIVPPGINQATSVGWADADATYYKAFGMFIATLIGNITPANVEFVSKSLSGYMDSAVYSDVRKKMIALADSREFRETAGATKFVPTAIAYEPDTNKVFVAGQMTVVTAQSSTKIADDLTYEMVVKMREGRPVITAITSYPGIDPHDNGWIKRQAENDAAKNGKK